MVFCLSRYRELILSPVLLGPTQGQSGRRWLSRGVAPGPCQMEASPCGTVGVDWGPPIFPGTSVGQDAQVSPVRPLKEGGPPSSFKVIHGGWGFIGPKWWFSTRGDLETGCFWGVRLHLVGRGQGYCKASLGKPTTWGNPHSKECFMSKC